MTREPLAYTCPRCGLRSYHPKDLEHRYCGRCHRFEADAACEDDETVKDCWLDESKEAVEFHNEMIERDGLILAKYRTF